MDAQPRTVALATPVSYGVIHFLVDAACVTAVLRATQGLGAGWLTAFGMVVGYDLLAFALQFPLGLLVDRWRAARLALLAGIVLAALVVAPVALPASAIMLAAGIGNALFHLGAGAEVLAGSAGRAAPAGVFVAPGALGLGLGMWMGKTGAGPVWPLYLGLALAAAFVLTSRRPPGRQAAEAARAPMSLASAVGLGVLLLLLVSVTVRSYVGLGGCHGCPRETLVVAGLPLAGFLGKLVGGFLADRLGWIRTSVGALVLSAPFIALAAGNPYVALPGLLLFQMTMPVTLTAVFLMMPRHPATAFGLPCLALVGGALFTFHPAGRALFGTATFLGLIALAALAVYVALRELRRRGAGLGGFASFAAAASAHEGAEQAAASVSAASPAHESAEQA